MVKIFSVHFVNKKSAKFTFPNSKLSLNFIYKGNGLGSLKFVGKEFDFPSNFDEFVNDGRTTEHPIIDIVIYENINIFCTVGGCYSYIFNLEDSSVRKIELFRERRDSEYWYSKYELTEFGLLIIYEGGILLLNEMLNQEWHISKYYNEYVTQIKDDKIYLEIEDEASRSIPLQRNE